MEASHQNRFVQECVAIKLKMEVTQRQRRVIQFTHAAGSLIVSAVACIEDECAFTLLFTCICIGLFDAPSVPVLCGHSPVDT